MSLKYLVLLNLCITVLKLFAQASTYVVISLFKKFYQAVPLEKVPCHRDPRADVPSGMMF
jgi:hypothetical protein